MPKGLMQGLSVPRVAQKGVNDPMAAWKGVSGPKAYTRAKWPKGGTEGREWP